MLNRMRTCVPAHRRAEWIQQPGAQSQLNKMWEKLHRWTHPIRIRRVPIHELHVHTCRRMMDKDQETEQGRTGDTRFQYPQNLWWVEDIQSSCARYANTDEKHSRRHIMMSHDLPILSYSWLKATWLHHANMDGWRKNAVVFIYSLFIDTGASQLSKSLIWFSFICKG